MRRTRQSRMVGRLLVICIVRPWQLSTTDRRAPRPKVQLGSGGSRRRMIQHPPSEKGERCYGDMFSAPANRLARRCWIAGQSSAGQPPATEQQTYPTLFAL
eukprot:1301197-Pyramimonas_sp.AAC.1